VITLSRVHFVNFVQREYELRKEGTQKSIRTPRTIYRSS